jgi:3,4-dihydroxy 2-butanone 4-phosphate synthase/GTP cyclohydrolase II|tara:strand:+ start:11386 stop:12510 length:1125 start_codon:yes stop_codon:yes gene_type:complete
MKFNSTEEIIADIAAGKMVIIIDDEDRENEGDLLMAASMVKPEDINFMATHGRGLICLTLTRERCQQLNLPLMVDAVGDNYKTNFTVSIEAAEGVTTGISAYDRAHTVRTAVAPNAKPSDIEQPGHIFPLMAKPGGVLTRAGHTEAGCDFARLAALEPAAVIVEIMNEDGTMARRPDLEKFAKEFDLKIGTIEDLISYRMQHEPTVRRISVQPFTTDYGDFQLHTYEDAVLKQVHFALVKGEITADKAVLTRVHLENTIIDSLLGKSEAFGWPLRDAIQRIAAEEVGVVVLLRIGNDAGNLIKQLQRLDEKERGTVAENAEPNANTPVDRRTLGIGGQILFDVGVHKMRLLSAKQVFHGLGGFGLEIVEYVSGK